MKIGKGSKVALVGCSDSNRKKYIGYVERTVALLREAGLDPIVYESVFSNASDETVDPKIRASNLMDAFMDKSIDAIFDVTGGDACKEILDYVDFESIKLNPKPFFGYSDNSVIINPLRQLSGIDCYYYQIKFIADSRENFDRFCAFIERSGASIERSSADHDSSGAEEDLGFMDFYYRFLQGTALKGSGIAGGNIRCTLKLFDTKYKPDFRDKVLFLESYGGDLCRIKGFLTQLKDDGVFSACSSVLLGNFSAISREGNMENLYSLVLDVIDDKTLPVACTMDLGHQSDARCLSYQLEF